jgi:hypothetical protein
VTSNTTSRRARPGFRLGAMAIAAAMAVITASQPAAAAATAVPSPNLTPNDNVFAGVDGVATNDVWAAGYGLADPRGNPRSTLARWNGSAWSLVDHPRPAGISMFSDVDAVTASDAWAVGRSNPQVGQPGRTLVERWDGRAWRIVASPNAEGSNVLNAVEAAAANDVWAVGSHSTNSFGPLPLALRWNGQQWRTVATPASVQGFNLTDVDATSSTNAWAVGTKIASPIFGGFSATALRWNGTAWQEVPLPSANNLVLNGVATVGPNDVWAVGARIGAPNSVPVAFHWNGSAWTQVPTPVRSPAGGELADVVAVSPSNAYAVGTATANGIERALFLRWNGSTWAEVSAPTSGFEPALTDVTAIGDRTAWAVGSIRVGPRFNPGPKRTLTLRVTS